VAKLADDRRFVLTAEMALMVLDALDHLEGCDRLLHVYYAGRQELRGVLRNTPYPVCWICQRDGQPSAEDRVLRWQPETNYDPLRQFLREYLDNTEGLRRLFVVGDEHPRYRGGPDKDMEDARVALDELLRDHPEQGTPEEQAGSPDAAPLPEPDLATLGLAVRACDDDLCGEGGT
jgi:hypothetical protein